MPEDYAQRLEALQLARGSLERERDRLSETIQTYPPPIPACDAHFNHLLAERVRIARELAVLNEAERELRAAGV